MKVSLTKFWMGCLLMLSSVFGINQQANAGIPVFDGSNFANMLISAGNQAQQLAQYAQQISQFATQIDQVAHGNALSAQMLNQLGLGGFNDLNSSISQSVQAIGQLQSAVSTITRDVNNVQSQFNNLYNAPNGFSNMSPAQLLGMAQNWSTALQQANKAALQSQSVVNNIQNYNNQMSNILSTAGGSDADSQVAQIQSTNQMLGIMGQQLNDMNQQIADANRAIVAYNQQQQSYNDMVMAGQQSHQSPTSARQDSTYAVQ